MDIFFLVALFFLPAGEFPVDYQILKHEFPNTEECVEMGRSIGLPNMVCFGGPYEGLAEFLDGLVAQANSEAT